MSLEKRNLIENTPAVRAERALRREQAPALPQIDTAPARIHVPAEPRALLAEHWRTPRRNPSAGQSPFREGFPVPGWKTVGVTIMTISAALLVFTAWPAGLAALGFLAGFGVVLADLFGWTPQD